MKRRDVVAIGTAIAVTGMAAGTTATPNKAAAQTRPGTAATAAASGNKFTNAQLDQMLAPIALYPDTLMSQVLMAATYPLEIVEAARWSKENPNLKGDAAVAAAKDKGWDVSVTSLVAFPQVLQMMNSKLDWVQNVGDAMISQQSDVAASIQRLRAQAKTAGTLKSTPQQKVVEQPPSSGAPAATPPAIVIEPAIPEVVYVPTYNPATVYGTWPYPAYPPTYFPPPPGYDAGAALLGGLAFGVGIAAGAAMFGGWHWGGGWGGSWGWGGWSGGNSYTTVNVNKATNITNNFNRNRYNNNHWSHDPAHRHSVPYRNRSDRQRYGQHHPTAEQRQAFRGQLDHHGGQRGGNENRGGERNHAMSGVNHGSQVRNEANRGHSYNNRNFSHANHGNRGGQHGGHRSSIHHGGGYHTGGHSGGGHGGRR